jgi:hypothetical protein
VIKKKYKEFKKGIYRPINSNKYIGGDKCIYRSSWELKAFKFLDKNPKVLRWCSERVIIPYMSRLDNRMHKYYVDLFAEIQFTNGTKKKYLIEVKPYKKTLPPVESKRKKKTTILHEKVEYVQNQDKWSHAKQYCKVNKLNWMILTEKGIYINDDQFYEVNIFI